jgi:molybdopterin molybdotransferase
MIETNKALEIILNHTEGFGVEEINFIDSVGRIIKEDIKADRDFPPFDRISMDGIAISAKTFNSGSREFKIEGVQAAGSEQLTLHDSNNCLEAMTGAVLPVNTDAIIPYELITIENGIAKVNINEIKYFQNIHKKGIDRKQNEILLTINTVISPAEIGVLATVGKEKVKVAKAPEVIIISTGDELVEVNQTPHDYQIRRSNVYTLVALLDKLKIKATTIHIKDNKALLKNKIKDLLNKFDVLIFSGAVSKGKFDYLPEIFKELEVNKLFHKVKQRPGKPFWFGKKDDKTVFAFPGNPVSTFVSCMKYFYPWYQKSMNLNHENKNYALLAQDFIFKPDLTYYLQVKMENKNGVIYAYPLAGKGSGDLANLVENDAFIELPPGKEKFRKGEVFPLIIYR